MYREREYYPTICPILNEPLNILPIKSLKLLKVSQSVLKYFNLRHKKVLAGFSFMKQQINQYLNIFNL